MEHRASVPVVNQHALKSVQLLRREDDVIDEQQSWIAPSLSHTFWPSGNFNRIRLLASSLDKGSPTKSCVPTNTSV
eukprot:1397770-Amphidinium_carterae.1